MRRLYLSRFFFTASVICFTFSIFLLWQRTTPKRLAFSQIRTSTQQHNPTNLPIGMQITSQNIVVPVYPAKVTHNVWETTGTGISYLSTSALPGSKGNSIFYGHNWRSLLGNLKNVKKSDKITILLTDGTKVHFTVAYTVVVSPNQTHILDQTTDSRLTVYTCTGFLDQQRLVVVAHPDQ